MERATPDRTPDRDLQEPAPDPRRPENGRSHQRHPQTPTGMNPPPGPDLDGAMDSASSSALEVRRPACPVLETGDTTAKVSLTLRTPDDLRWLARHWATRIGVKLTQIHIRPMRSKWASMSIAGRLTLNTDLLAL